MTDENIDELLKQIDSEMNSEQHKAQEEIEIIEQKLFDERWRTPEARALYEAHGIEILPVSNELRRELEGEFENYRNDSMRFVEHNISEADKSKILEQVARNNVRYQRLLKKYGGA